LIKDELETVLYFFAAIGQIGLKVESFGHLIMRLMARKAL